MWLLIVPHILHGNFLSNFLKQTVTTNQQCNYHFINAAGLNEYNIMARYQGGCNIKSNLSIHFWDLHKNRSRFIAMTRFMIVDISSFKYWNTCYIRWRFSNKKKLIGLVETEQIKTHRCIHCEQKTNRLVCSIITIDIEFQPLSYVLTWNFPTPRRLWNESFQ